MNIPSLVIGLAAGLFIGILACILYRNKKAKDDKEKIANAEEEALRIINDAIKSAESKKREATLEAKEEILRSRKEYEKEEKERRADLQKQERRLQQKEENIDRKTDAIEKKEEALAQKHAALDKENEEIKIIKRSQTEMLERISGFTADEAKKYLIEQVESEVTHETALKIKEIEARAKDEADQYAREIVASAIQRCAADHVAEITVSVVPLPNDEMKGRIIGREGRNIRTIETLTGVDLIIDDTPEADAIEKKEEALAQKHAALDKENEEIKIIKRSQTEMLERISGFTADEAKKYLIEQVESEVTHETALKIKEIEARAKDEADQYAREIVASAIQRCAADHVAEITVSVVPLPNDEMKGRIIGREGRNIRTIETLTGVDLIIDDTPEAITVSCFEPVRREVARLALEKLIADGRIHPTHIEEMVAKARREVDAVIKSEGERAVLETGVRGLHPELVKLLGRLHYRTSYGQNVLQHSIEVAHLAGMMAAELGADVATAKRAGLLHDIGKAVDHELEGTHVALGVEFLRKYHEREDVIHAVQAHHNDVEPQTVVACLVQAADAISAARPGARRENIENYIKRLEKLEEITGSYPGVETSYAIQAGREVRVMVKPEQVSEDDMVILARELAKRIESELEYPGQIKVHVLRETKVIEYAK